MIEITTFRSSIWQIGSARKDTNSFSTHMEGMLKIDKQPTASDGLFIRVLLNRILVDVVTQSAKTNMNVEDVFFTIARDIKQRLAETDSKPEVIPRKPPEMWIADWFGQ